MPRFYVTGQFYIEADNATDAENAVQNAVEDLPEHFGTEDVTAAAAADDGYFPAEDIDL